MDFEREITLKTGRCVKVFANAVQNHSRVAFELIVLVKDPDENTFYPPIGPNHSKYWQLKRLNAQLAGILQLRHSGVSDREMKQILDELNEMVADNKASHAADLKYS
ncbi:hypothetical protein [Dyadobacter sp. CY351]|uniref:hypothetical protein n=1 Tax=Dyadobacter sp. CY351 TaxID=2909337 RepID=UPI001F43A3E4|nr:hypothetical protein [Dyadobacter sp. CY351]MCF2518671.1 hypothetical protein [Dyadobacter sp. CY351]